MTRPAPRSWDPLRIPREAFPRIVDCLCIVLVIITAINLVLGWGMGWDVALRLRSGYSAMVPSTALSVMLIAIALLASSHMSAHLRVLPRLAAAFAASVAVANILVRAMSDGTGIDQLLQPELVGADGTAFATSSNTLLVSASVLLSYSRSDRVQKWQTITATSGLMINFAVILGYIFDVDSIYGIPFFRSMSLYSALSFLIAYMILLCLRPEVSWISHLHHDGIGSVGARRLAPLVIGGPIALGYMMVGFQNGFVVTANFGFCVITVFMIGISAFAVIRNASHENRDQMMLERYVQELQQSNDDKAMLISEVYHRVKNNLQQICAIIEFERRNVRDETVAKRLEVLTDRVKSIAYVHQILIGANNPSEVNVRGFLTNIIGGLEKGFDLQNRSISVQLNCSDDTLNIEKSVPLGLLVNEVVTNAIKHAFNEQGGTIIISYSEADGVSVLAVEDNGIGYDRATPRTGIGSMIIEGLVRQLQGTMQRQNANGTRVEIAFSEHGTRKMKGIAA